MMAPKKATNNPRKIEVPTDTPTEFELRDTAADIRTRRVERLKREREKTERLKREDRVGEKRKDRKNGESDGS